jgi:pilus assembly protein CpaE
LNKTFMTDNVLIIDDEVVFHSLISKSLEGFDFNISYAENGNSGLSQARAIKPELIICDVMMPDITGYEVVRSLRREPEFAHTPILMLTAQSGLQDKLKAFEAGADEYITKPFEPAELVARIAVLLRRAEARKTAPPNLLASAEVQREDARMIVVHSLRGGTGCSSLAVNLAVALHGLWRSPTNLIDLTMMAGQVALMLNVSLKRTWADVSHYKSGEIDLDVINSIISRHESGLDFIAAPTLPTEADTIKPAILGEAFVFLKGSYDYIVADLPHNFDETTLQVLDTADLILMVATPDMASVRASAAALDTYNKLGYPIENIKFILNATFPRLGLQHEKIAAALGLPVSMIIPYAPDLFVEAINAGRPFMFARPDEHISTLIEDYAFNISKPAQKKTRPAAPTEGWQRVYRRYNERRK